MGLAKSLECIRIALARSLAWRVLIPGNMTTNEEIALGHTTVLAAYLNAAMANDAMARMAYALMYGAEWSPLGNGATINDGASTVAGTVR